MPDLAAYRFTSTHEWVRQEGSEATVGITDHAQAELGDVIFLELPAVGSQLSAGDRFGTVESVKAASDLYSPVAGTVAAVNEELKEHPERVNQSPYEDGWLLRLSGVSEGSVELLAEDAYEAKLAAGA